MEMIYIRISHSHFAILISIQRSNSTLFFLGHAFRWDIGSQSNAKQQHFMQKNNVMWKREQEDASANYMRCFDFAIFYKGKL